MSTTIILPPASALEAAAAELMRDADVRRCVTLNKSLYDLLTQDARIIRVNGGYLVPSSTRNGIVHRIDDVQGCSCEAGRAQHFCRHVAAIQLIEHAQIHTMPALAPMGDRLARARAAAAEFNAEI